MKIKRKQDGSLQKEKPKKKNHAHHRSFIIQELAFHVIWTQTRNSWNRDLSSPLPPPTSTRLQPYNQSQAFSTDFSFSVLSATGCRIRQSAHVFTHRIAPFYLPLSPASAIDSTEIYSFDLRIRKVCGILEWVGKKRKVLTPPNTSLSLYLHPFPTPRSFLYLPYLSSLPISLSTF